MELFDLSHHGLVHCQPPGCIYKQYIGQLLLGALHRSGSDCHWRLIGRRFYEGYTHLGRQSLQLLNCRGPVDISTHHRNTFFLLLFEQPGKLRYRGSFTGTLQARHQNHRGRRGCQIKTVVFSAHDRDKFFVHDFDKGFAWIKRSHNRLTERLAAHLLNKIFYNRQSHICLKQGHAHITQSITDVIFVYSCLAADLLQARRESF